MTKQVLELSEIVINGPWVFKKWKNGILVLVLLEYGKFGPYGYFGNVQVQSLGFGQITFLVLVI